VVLIGPGAAGKSTWAAAHFPADSIVSSDRLRAMVGTGEDDITASADAFALLDRVVAFRLSRRLTTVIDTLGLDADRRRAWLDSARRAGMPCVAVAFDTPPVQCRERNRGRTKRIPADALAQQLKAWVRTRELLPDEGFDAVLEPEPVRVVPEGFVAASEAARRQQERPTGLRFGLHIGTFGFGPGKLAEIAAAAEAAGFDAIYVMDHFRQIPQVGRAWDDFLESYTTLAWLAAHTERVRLGALVTGITYRNVAHLGKIVATLDVLSGGRAVCGLGLAWFEAEHRAYGWEFPPVNERYALLEDALQLLPLLWGPGSPAFQGAVISVPEAVGYPRPVQAHVPIILGGSGPRTLRLAARYADVANVFGDAATVARRAALLSQCAAEAGRTVELSHLSTVLVGADDEQVRGLVERLRPRRQDPARFAAAVNAGTVADHVGRCRELAEAGVSEIVVRLADLVDPAPVERMAEVISAFR
jgi:alkanesulfonate monooxygenase SsuD/methylene tetrahydromethanopterin reductase-like flavin-dependent oxidoreductase (luciferase family)/predicted kinase